MKNKSLEERYSSEVLSNNAAEEKCKQCKDCIFRSDGTIYSNDFQKGNCSMFPYPQTKPIGVIKNTEPCELYEKE